MGASATTKQKRKEADEGQKYFPQHECRLKGGIPNSYVIECGKFRRRLLKLTTVRNSDIRAFYMYRSYAALCAEKHRQFNQYPLSIHPFSILRTCIEAIVIVCIIVSDTLLPFWFSKYPPLRRDYLFYTIVAFDTVYLINIIAGLFTGYVAGKNHQYVVLDSRKVICRYALTWMFVDLATLTSVFSNLIYPKWVVLKVTLISMKILRLPILYTYVQNLCKITNSGVATKTAVELILCLICYLSWNIVFQFSTEYIKEGSAEPISADNCSWISIGNLWNETSTIRFWYSMERAVGMLRDNANLNLIEYNGCFEMFFIMAWLIAKLLVFHCAFKYMLVLFGSESARAKYYMMSQQVQTYMDHKRYPPRIQKKILKFYAIRFYSHFFVESRMMDCVSGQLREDMIMYTGRQLVREVAFLKQLPHSVLMQICLRFQLVIFIEGDVIIKINTIGDSIFFIHKGTVAVYSESGREICHLEDGDYFGEMELVMKHKFRFASVVAVTNCELFSLSREAFESITSYPTVYEEIRKEATSRLERIILMDELYKAQAGSLTDRRGRYSN